MPGQRIWLVFALASCAAFGQQVPQTIVFSHVDSPKALQEYLNAIRSVSEIRAASANWEDKSITLNGTEEQISLAAWLAKELNDAPAGRSAMMQHDYPGAIGSDQEVRVYYLAHTATDQERQEVVNIVRSVADIRCFFPVNEIGAIAARGTPQQLDMAEWLLNELDR